jgi:hypothetical protein
MSGFTIERLNALKRGEKLVYYRGNFEYDIERCNDDDVPAYGLILLRLRDTASSLARTGKLRLEKYPYGHTNSGLFEYLAIGL